MPPDQPTTPTLPATDKLRFSVAPNIVEDLGVNLYTTLPKALVEFVANAYDADAKSVKITIPEDDIVQQSELVSLRLKHWRKSNPDKADEAPPELQTLDEAHAIVIEDTGDGMSRDDMEHKFLVIGRRKRASTPSGTTIKGRAFMGRKGIGKLAGFGVAHRMIVESRRAGEQHATRIQLNLEDLQKVTDTRNLEIVAERVEDGCRFAEKGTRITLTRLVPHAIQVKRKARKGADEQPSILSDVTTALSDHFYAIDPADFAIELNNSKVEPTKVEFEKCYPEVEGLAKEALVDFQYQPEGSEATFPVSYRIRFRGAGGQLTQGVTSSKCQRLRFTRAVSA